MNAPLILAAAVAAATVTALAVTTFAGPRAGVPEPETPVATPVQVLQEQVEALQRRLDQLEHKPMTAAPQDRVPVPTLSDAQIDTALQDWLRRQGASRLTDALARQTKGAASAPRGDANALFAELATPGLTQLKAQDVWTRAKEQGQIDALVALFENKAKENPRLADAQAELGNAYLQKLFTVGYGPEAGVWGTKADKTFDAALELDPNHWQARFSKAVSLSNWPAFLGRQKEAIDNFEVLVKQQESSGNGRSDGLQTYLILGNLYSQQGKSEKALEVWKKGLAAFPQSKDLKDKLTPKK